MAAFCFRELLDFIDPTLASLRDHVDRIESTPRDGPLVVVATGLATYKTLGFARGDPAEPSAQLTVPILAA
jgi:hypothetical protein